jgi:AmmeMemoRadiSam system protein A
VLEDVDLDLLFQVAEDAILEGLRRGDGEAFGRRCGRRWGPRPGGAGRGPGEAPSLDRLPDALRAPVNAFVTLLVDGALNGCIGSIDGGQPLALAVAHHAWSAAFADPRLPPLRAEDLAHLVIEISLLSPLEPVPSGSREELVTALRPHVDGLVLGVGARRGLFLPAVWEQLPDPEDFVDHLLVKAGLARGAWPAGLAASRFSAVRHARKARAQPPGAT